MIRDPVVCRADYVYQYRVEVRNWWLTITTEGVCRLQLDLRPFSREAVRQLVAEALDL